MASVGLALILDMTLGIVAIIRVVMYKVGFASLTGTFILVDIIILSIIIIIFLIGIATINTTVTTTVQELLMRTKKEILSEMSSHTMLEKEADVIYLSAMNEHLVASQNLYMITILGFQIDMKFVRTTVLAMLASVISALLAVLKKDFQHAD
jgi:hypothetical protein